MSQSKLKNIADGIEEFKYAVDHHREPTPEMILGTAVHTLLLEPHLAHTIVTVPKYHANSREGKIQAFIKEGKRLDFFPIAKGKTKKPGEGLFYEVDLEEYAFANDTIEKYAHIFENINDYQVLSEEDLARAQAMAASVRANEDANRYLTACTAFEEYSEYTYKGIRFKRSRDGVGARFVLDLKTTSIKNNRWKIKKEIEDRGYDFQAVSYMLEDNKEEYIIIFVRSVAPYACFPVKLSETTLDAGFQKFDAACDTYNDCIENNPTFTPNNRLVEI